MSWLRLDAETVWDPRILALPSDEARWAYVEALCFAKLQQPEGVFRSLAQYAAVTRRDPSVLSDLVGTGLLEEDAHGAIWVAGWEEKQQPKDRTGSKRQREWRERQKQAQEVLRNGVSNALPDQTNDTDDATRRIGTLPDNSTDESIQDLADQGRSPRDPSRLAPSSTAEMEINQLIEGATGYLPSSVQALKPYKPADAVAAVRQLLGSSLDPDQLIASAAQRLQQERAVS